MPRGIYNRAKNTKQKTKKNAGASIKLTDIFAPKYDWHMLMYSIDTLSNVLAKCTSPSIHEKVEAELEDLLKFLSTARKETFGELPVVKYDGPEE